MEQRRSLGVVKRSIRLPFPASTVTSWEARPGAIERLTPPWERADPLARGRDSRWTHVHRVEPDGSAACIVTDRVDSAAPAAGLGLRWGEGLVRQRLERILAYRHAILAQDLAAHERFAATGPLRIAVTGAGGLVGRALAAFLDAGGHTIVRLVRRPSMTGDITWNAAAPLSPAVLEGSDAVIHLAGENIAAGRWTAARRRGIRESRLLGTAALAGTIQRLTRPPRIFVSAAAIGIYGDRGDELLDENSALGPPGRFLGDLCREWEAATGSAREAGVRVALPRFGAVLSPAGGALAKMLPFFRAGLGGPVGSGRQWMSWLSLEDAIGAVYHALFTDSLDGPFNAVAPAPVTNAEFSRTLGRVLGRPAALPVPAAALRLVLGAMAEETVLPSTRVIPSRLAASGYQFRHPRVEDALRFELGRFAAE